MCQFKKNPSICTFVVQRRMGRAIVSSPTKPASSGFVGVGLVPDGGCLIVFLLGGCLLWLGLEPDEGCMIVLLVFWLNCLLVLGD